MKKSALDGLIRKYGPNYVLEVLRELNAFYECPKKGGIRVGPLVGYAGTYNENGEDHHYVGDVYCNFSVSEQYPFIIKQFAQDLAKKLEQHFADELHEFIDNDRLVIVGPQMGGISIGNMLALELGCRFAYVEKKITQLASAGGREESTLAFIRHVLRAGDIVIICEDVSNNFSTTQKTIDLILEKGANPLALATLLNRSMTVKDLYADQLPVIPLVYKPFEEYKKTDPAVTKDIEAGNVVWKPKNDWSRLKSAMLQAV
jgi:adenine/guanine phosphoribosyltransferase-like PRPP-binding protein